MPLHASSATFLILVLFALPRVFWRQFPRKCFPDMPMHKQVRRNNSSRSTPARLHWSVSTSGEGEDLEQEYKKYRSTLEQEHIRSRRRFKQAYKKYRSILEQEHIRSRRRFKARAQKIQKYIGAGEHPEQEKIQSESTRNTEVHWSRSTCEDDSEQE